MFAVFGIDRRKKLTLAYIQQQKGMKNVCRKSM